MTMSHEELVVVSGASTGMGAATARELARRGYHVLAGVRNEQAAGLIRGEGIEPVMLDITNPEHVAALAKRVHEDARPLRALINNAGMAANAPVETLPLPVWRTMFEVNLFGHIAMIQALLPELRASRGRIVNISSTGGRIVVPAFGAYSATKFAVEAMSDALRREVARQGVSVVVVQPGAVRTEMGATGTRTANDLLDSTSTESRGRYTDVMKAFFAQATEFGRSGMPAERAGKVIADVATTKRPRTRYTIGRDGATFTLLSRLLSDGMLDHALAANERRLLAHAAPE
ncbi:MAG: SDR family oxidoreductase [Propionicimonas sp.]|uniref:SDR family oxidoreductase n=1 Tax=Propionicimonas sp. TaxID=1955623 RepID=UPI003D129967